MPFRFIRMLMLLALLLAPAGMAGRHAAMAAPAAAAAMGSGHCAETGMRHDAPAAPEQGQGLPSAAIDCLIACACVPPVGGALAEAVAPAPLPHASGRSLMPAGRNPAADPPPPRYS
jgi:hypothetical protein